jgi:hypothetical protein
MSVKQLRSLSIIYLLAPNLLFYYSWINLPLGILGILTLVYLIIKELKDVSFSVTKVLGKKDFLVVGLVSLFLTVVSGVNGYVFQNIDYWAHNVKYYELIHSAWPIRFPADGPVISYYYGYYVIPALFSAISGTISESFLFIWTWFGLALGIAWLSLALNKRIIYVLWVLFIGDLPRVIKKLFSWTSVGIYELGEFGVEHWSNFENLFWVPNQAIPTLIIGGMTVYVLSKKLNIDLLILPIALSFWWAIFPAFTSAVFVGVLVIRSWVIARFEIEWFRVINNVVIPFVVCLPILIFFLSHKEPAVSGFLWKFTGTSGIFTRYLFNVGTNILLLLTAYMLLRKQKLTYLNQTAFFFIIFLSALFSLYRIGDANDFLLRGMMPILLIIGIFVFYPLTTLSARETYALFRSSALLTLVFSLLAASSLLGITRIYRAATVNRFTSELNSKASFKPMPYDAYTNVYDLLKDKWSQEGANQYMGDTDSFYEKHLAPEFRNEVITKKQKQ